MPSAVLSARRDAGGGLLLVSLDVDDAAARAYTAPGQYVKITVEGGKGYFVLASNVGATPWQLLVKNSGDAADALYTRPLGTTIAFEGPLGSGFPFAQTEGRSVVIAVVASALGVARPVIAHRTATGAAAATHLFLGLRSPLDLPIADEVQSWTEEGVAVVLCLSRSELDHHAEILPRAQRVTGYVQLALSRALESGAVPHGSLVIAAGSDEMLADMQSLAAARGSASLVGPTIEILTNV